MLQPLRLDLAHSQPEHTGFKLSWNAADEELTWPNNLLRAHGVDLNRSCGQVSSSSAAFNSTVSSSTNYYMLSAGLSHMLFVEPEMKLYEGRCR